jgi:hypothetical protein
MNYIMFPRFGNNVNTKTAVTAVTSKSLQCDEVVFWSYII